MQKKVLFSILLCFSFAMAFAQNKIIKGKVFDKATGKGLGNVNVLVNNQKGGTSTKEDGSYSISVGKNGTTLLFSYVNYESQTILIENKTEIDVKLIASTKTEEEVVMIGYGTQKRTNVTGAVAKYDNKNLEETPSARLDQALQGKIAGVQVQNLTSEAGGDVKVQVRGLSSINASAAPLVVVDGHPVPDGLAFVNMADVQSVEVLKDAASASIYGSRAANGVILITTKSGKVNKTRYSLKSSVGVKQAYELYDVMTSSEYTNLLYYEAALRAQDPAWTGATNLITPNERAAYIIENTIRGGQATDWQREVIRTAHTQNLQLSVSGGNNAVKYYLAGGYQKDQGMMTNSEYDRYNVKAKVDIELSKKLSINFNINPSLITRERPATPYTDFVRFQSYLPVYLDENTASFVRAGGVYPNVKAGEFAQARYFNGRFYNGLMPDGSFYTSTVALTPFSTANNTPKSVLETRNINQKDYRVTTGMDINYKISKSLSFKSLGSVYVNYTDGLDFTKSNSSREGDINQGIYTNRLYTDLLNENTLNFSKRFKQHTVDAVVGFTAQKTIQNSSQITGYGYPSDNITTLNTASIKDQNSINTFTNRFSTLLISGLSRISYSYSNKYLVSASIRADGSSLFAPGRQWGYFPSVSLGWVASKEKFLQNADWLNNLKLRASKGTTGNNAIVPFAFLDLLTASNYNYGAGTGTLGVGQAPVLSVLSDPELTWELTNQTNLGLDISILKNKINLTVDAYESKTKRLLLQQGAMAITGSQFTWNNIGRLQNRGIEIALNTNQVRTKNLSWSTTANYSMNRNKLINLGDDSFLQGNGERSEVYRNQVGKPFVEYFGYKTDGVWLSAAQITADTSKGLRSTLSNYFQPGGIKIVDLNGDDTIDVRDRTVLGNPNPDFIFGITNNFTYKAFDLMFLIQGSIGGELVNGDMFYNENRRYNRNFINNRWISPGNPGDGQTPYSTSGIQPLLTDYTVEDASYYALREILVGYTLPKKFTSKAKLNSMRIYFSAQNVFFKSADGYRGVNPESRNKSGIYASPLIDGYQRGAFPINKTYLIGLDLDF